MASSFPVSAPIFLGIRQIWKAFALQHTIFGTWEAGRFFCWLKNNPRILLDNTDGWFYSLSVSILLKATR